MGGKDAPMQRCFEDPKNQEYKSEWILTQPPLLHATVLSQIVLSFDVTPSEDGTTRWAHEADVREDGSACHREKMVWYKARGLVASCGGRQHPHTGVLSRAKYEEYWRLRSRGCRRKQTSKRLLLPAARKLCAVDANCCRMQLDWLKMNHKVRNPHQVHECDLHGMTIGDGTARQMLEEHWAKTMKAVNLFETDFTFDVIFGAGDTKIRGVHQ